MLLAIAGYSSLYSTRAQALQAHDPIVINHDSGFAACRCVSGGDGTIANPWIISGLEVTGVPPGEPRAGMSITNTRSYFVVRDVYIHPPTVVTESSGVYLLNVTNGRLENSRVTNTSYGVWMSLSNNNILANNTFWGIARTGLYIVGGEDNVITQNKVSSNFPGVKTPLLSDPKLKYVDLNNNNLWTPRSGTTSAEPIVYDSNNSDTYDQGEPAIFGTAPNNGASLKFDPRLRVFDINSSGAWDSGDSVVEDSGNNGVFNSGEEVLSSLSPEGIRAMGVATTTISENDVENVHTGVLISSSHTSLFDRNLLANISYYGFRIISQTSGNNFRNNTITRTSYGLVFDNSNHNLASGNMLFENDYAIGLEGLSGLNTGMTIKGNTVVNNLYGVYVFNSERNLIYDNYLNNTPSNAFDPTTLNFWNTNKTLGKNILGGPFLGGNFYTDYAGPDTDADGIGETARVIPGAQPPGPQALDRLPLVHQQPGIVRDIAIAQVKVQPPSVVPGDSFTIIVYPFNQGTVQETFTVTTYHGQNLLDTRTLTLPPWTQESYSFQWSSGLSTGGYSVTANATIIPGELDSTDNAAEAQAIVNTLPAATFTVNPQAPTANVPAVFDGSQSDDLDGTILSYLWDFGDGQTSNGATLNHIYLTPRKYNVTLTVTDNLGGTGSSLREITVTASPNKDPVPDFSATTPTPKVGQQVTFDASDSDDPDGNIIAYSWDFGDGTKSTGKVVDHTYSRSGTFIVTLTVTDDVGASKPHAQSLTVSATKPLPPTNLVLIVGADSITLTWSAPSSDGGSQIAQYRIYRGLSSSSLTLVAQVGNVNNYEDRAVLRGETYYYRITAVNGGGQEGDPGELSGRIESSRTSFLDNPIVLTGIAAALVAVAVIAALLLLRRPRYGLQPPG